MPSYEFDALRLDNPDYVTDDSQMLLLATSNRQISPLFRLCLSVLTGWDHGRARNWSFRHYRVRELMVMDAKKYALIRDAGLTDKVIANALATNYWQKPQIEIDGIYTHASEPYHVGEFKTHKPYIDTYEAAAVTYMLCYQPQSATDLQKAFRIIDLMPTGSVDPAVLTMLTRYEKELTADEISAIHPYVSQGYTLEMAFKFLDEGIDSELALGMAQR